MARLPVPDRPELARHGNGLRLIRFPFKTDKGTTVTRTFKLGWVDDEEAERQWKIFNVHWEKLHGAAHRVIDAMANTPPRTKGRKKDPLQANLPAVIPEPQEDEKPDDELEKKRAYSREYYHRQKNKKNAGPGPMAHAQAQLKMLSAQLHAIALNVQLLGELIGTAEED